MSAAGTAGTIADDDGAERVLVRVWPPPGERTDRWYVEVLLPGDTTWSWQAGLAWWGIQDAQRFVDRVQLGAPPETEYRIIHEYRIRHEYPRQSRATRATRSGGGE